MTSIEIFPRAAAFATFPHLSPTKTAQSVTLQFRCLKICLMERCPVAREKLLSTFLFSALDSFRRSFGTFRAIGENVFPSRWRRKDKKHEAMWKKSTILYRSPFATCCPLIFTAWYWFTIRLLMECSVCLSQLVQQDEWPDRSRYPQN